MRFRFFSQHKPITVGTKRILVISLVILTAIASLGLYFLLSPKSSSVTLRDFLQKPVVVPDSTVVCESTDVTEYLTYEDPRKDAPNNKFGLYVYAEDADFLELAQNLVNSNGGKWGYVLIPYNVKDRDYSKWRGVFDRLHNKQLIPIIQLWDVDVDAYEDQTEEAAAFLNSFVWPIRQRYVSVYNEPNDNKFWYGRADPAQYAEILDFTIGTFKEINSDFFMLNGALNVSASAGVGYYDAFDFMRRMDAAVPGIFSKLDGWASHSYPQPGFRGNPHFTGRNSIRAYASELAFLRNELGVVKELPVFITETGWAHAEGEEYNAAYLPVEKIAEYFQVAYEQYWLPDDRVRAVTPFTVWYPPPYDHFSWVNRDKVPYAHYEAIKSMEKVAGQPEKLVIKKVTIRECAD